MPKWLGGSSLCGVECVSLSHVTQVEQRAADTKDGRVGVSRLLKRHRAGGDFVQANRMPFFQITQNQPPKFVGDEGLFSQLVLTPGAGAEGTTMMKTILLWPG